MTAIPVPSIPLEKSTPGARASGMKSLYRLGVCGALGILAVVALQAPVFILYPPPATIAGHFALLHAHPLIGLLDLDLTLILAQVFTLPVLAALYAALRRSGPIQALAALGLGMTGILLFFVVNPTFSMLYLSDQYYAATDAAQKAALLAAGEALWANYNGTAFGLFFTFCGLAYLLMARLMWDHPAFGKPAAIAALLTGAMMLIPPLPTFGMIPLVMSYVVIIPSVAFQALAARGLLRLARQEA